jgi:hypothetical protein
MEGCSHCSRDASKINIDSIRHASDSRDDNIRHASDNRSDNSSLGNRNSGEVSYSRDLKNIMDVKAAATPERES